MTAEDYRLRIWRRCLLVAAGLAGLTALLLRHGTYLDPDGDRLVTWLVAGAVGLFCVELVLAAFTVRPWRHFLVVRWPALLLAVLLAGEIVVVRLAGDSWLAPLLRRLSITSLTQAYLVLVQFYILGNLLANLPTLYARVARWRIRPGLTFLLAFLGLIACGTGLLLLPRAAPPHAPLSLLDAVFTSTSAVCVTGLVVRDTATELSRFGQTIVLLLIQLGGLGIMSLTATFSWLLGRGIGIRESSFLRDVFQISSLGEVRRLLRFIVTFAVVTEVIGAALLYLGFGAAATGQPTRLYHALFHSVSAFCNAGFSTFSDSLVGFANDPLVIGTVSLLLIIGGLGFGVVANIVAYARGRMSRRPARNASRLVIQTRVVLILTACLLVGGTILLAFLEWDGAWDGRPPLQKLGLAWFQSATARTAGFNTVDIANLGRPALFLIVLLMFVGGAPGSTAGGVKLTTVAIVWANLQAIGKGRAQTRLLDREISLEAVRRAMLVLSGGMAFGALGIFLLLLSEDAGFMPTVFEAVSALGTVGLSVGLTGQLTVAGKLIVVVMMYLGRLGPLTFAYSLVPPARERHVRLPQAKIMVG